LLGLSKLLPEPDAAFGLVGAAHLDLFSAAPSSEASAQLIRTVRGRDRQHEWLGNNRRSARGTLGASKLATTTDEMLSQPSPNLRVVRDLKGGVKVDPPRSATDGHSIIDGTSLYGWAWFPGRTPAAAGLNCSASANVAALI